MSERPRMWKFVGLIHCPDSMVAIQYEIDSLDGDMDDTNEGRLMLAAVDVVRDAGLGIHRVRSPSGNPFVISAYAVKEHPMQARQWMSSH